MPGLVRQLMYMARACIAAAMHAVEAGLVHGAAHRLCRTGRIVWAGKGCVGRGAVWVEVVGGRSKARGLLVCCCAALQAWAGTCAGLPCRPSSFACHGAVGRAPLWGTGSAARPCLLLLLLLLLPPPHCTLHMWHGGGAGLLAPPDVGWQQLASFDFP